jgi:hypothetical protein
MDLVGIERSRIIFLTQVHRPSGQLYLPDAVAKVVERYSFFKAPSPDQAYPITFSVGKFQDVQISEFSIYNDGFTVSSASDTDILDAFIQELMSWASTDLGLVQVASSKSEKIYESSIVVKADTDLAEAIAPQNDARLAVADAMKSVGINAPLKLSGFLLDFDPSDFLGKAKPSRVTVDRRIGKSFSENIFFSQAPFRTKDHLNVLRSFEEMAHSKRSRRR